MQNFFIGQRWISDTEPDLGLGTIIEQTPRQVSVVFLSSGETRIYAKETAPLTRIQFAAGDTITTHDEQELEVSNVTEDAGCLTYSGTLTSGELAEVPESELNSFLKFNRPQDRLFAGQLDHRRWFNLRSDVYQHQLAYAKSSIRGLQGMRASLIPHQLYIAHEVSRRQSPRVLLADEVGLGKTIEAGMILHSQIQTHQINRVLIVVPESLVHQWLVEMLRRFNLRFHIMDGDTFAAALPSAPDANPFLDEQLILCSLDSLLADPLMQASVVESPWDMLIVDEAHHLHWTPEEPSQAYGLVEQLARIAPAVLLLTATPEQLGQQGHFARLKLLDADRFSDFEQFQAEEKAFSSIAELANALLDDAGIDAADIAQLQTLTNVTLSDSESAVLALPAFHDLAGIRDRLLTLLIDRHGTSRVLFRNTRSSIQGFPARQLQQHKLEPDAEDATSNIAAWSAWLIALLQQHHPEKFLVICQHAETVQAMAEQLRLMGVNSAQFHQHMSIIERDRAAAWFADTDDGCQVLLCSEIGSEGRNFQYLHHLVMFELPEVPDLLEQRIGRLDRIGQQQDIQIHVPYLPGSRDHSLLRWYHEGLDAMQSICKVGTSVAAALDQQLQAVLADDGTDTTRLDTLIEESQKLAATFNQQLEQGRDRLLELNSNRVELIQEQLDELQRTDRSYQLPDFMANVFNCFGVDYEEQSNQSYILKPGDHMQIPSFPGLKEDGLTVTYDRATALAREDFSFLSWDHPMVHSAMDLVLNEAFGQANAERISTDLLPQGVLFLEAVVSYHCGGDKSLNMQRYFPAALNRFMLGSNRKDYTSVLPELDIDSMVKRSDPTRIRRFLQNSRADINVLLRYTETLAEKTIPAIVAEARENIDSELDAEIARLENLALHNPSVRADEIDALRARKIALHETLQNTRYELTAISVLLNL